MKGNTMSNFVKPLAGVCAALLMSGCIEKEKIVTIPDAENLLFTSQGDLLVNGGKSIYQVISQTNSDGSTTYSRASVYEGAKCSFGGIAQQGDWVFSVCKEMYFKWKGFTFKLVQDTHLLAANLNERPLNFQALDQGLEHDPLDAMTIPNGIAFSPTGALIIADTNFFAQSNVGRITLDYSGNLPQVAQFEPNWLGSEYGFETPNGPRVVGDTLYISDANKVRRLVFNEAGEIPLLFTNAGGDEVSNLPDDNLFYTGGVIVDDILPYCDGIAVTQFLAGTLVYQDAQGGRYKTLPFSFDSPSALAIGEGPMFDGSDLMVTEKGVILEFNSGIGNQLSRVPMDFDLSEPLTCEALKSLD
jgi:hypothetical protein